MTWLSQASQETVLVLALGLNCMASTASMASTAVLCSVHWFTEELRAAVLNFVAPQYMKGSCCVGLPLGVWIELAIMPDNRKKQ